MLIYQSIFIAGLLLGISLAQNTQTFIPGSHKPDQACCKPSFIHIKPYSIDKIHVTYMFNGIVDPICQETNINGTFSEILFKIPKDLVSFSPNQLKGSFMGENDMYTSIQGSYIIFMKEQKPIGGYWISDTDECEFPLILQVSNL